MTTANGTDGDFYEDDEPAEEIQAAFERGEKGVTKRPRDLNQRAKSVVDRAVAHFEEQERVQLRVVASGTNTTTREVDSGEPNRVVEKISQGRPYLVR